MILKYSYVRGNVNITVDGDMRTYVKGDHYLEVEGDKHELIKGQKFTKIALNDVETIGQNKNTLVAQGLMLRANDYEELILDTKNSYVEKNNIILTGEKLTVSAKGDLKLATAGNVEMGASGTTNIVSQGQITIDGGAGMDVTVADQYIEKAAQIYMN
jgi:Ca2+-binding RTX toxin-like protein